MRWYPLVQWFDGAGFADLLRSTSVYRRLDRAVREPLLEAIAERIRTPMGDRAARRYLSVLACRRTRPTATRHPATSAADTTRAPQRRALSCGPRRSSRPTIPPGATMMTSTVATPLTIVGAAEVDLRREVRHERDEQGADDGAGDGAEPADDDPRDEG